MRFETCQEWLKEKGYLIHEKGRNGMNWKSRKKYMVTHARNKTIHYFSSLKETVKELAHD